MDYLQSVKAAGKLIVQKLKIQSEWSGNKNEA